MYQKFILAALVLLAPAAFAANCGPEPVAGERVLNIALTNLKSFEYVHGAIERIKAAVPQAEFCVSGLPLSRNTYQYMEYYIQIDVRAPSSMSPLYRFRFVFQDASVQALHNVGVKPWLALPPSATDALFQSLAEKAELKPVLAEGEPTIMAAAEKTLAYKSTKATLDEKTVAAADLNIIREDSIFSVTGWLTKPGTNPFASFPVSKTVFVARNMLTGELAVAENITTTEIKKQLYQILETTQPARGTDLTERLLQISAPQPGY